MKKDKHLWLAIDKGGILLRNFIFLIPRINLFLKFFGFFVGNRNIWFTFMFIDTSLVLEKNTWTTRHSLNILRRVKHVWYWHQWNKHNYYYSWPRFFHDKLKIWLRNKESLCNKIQSNRNTLKKNSKRKIKMAQTFK